MFKKIKSKKFYLRRQKLIERYLLWCYKTTKEALDRIDRKFTQMEVDRFILSELTRQPCRLSGENGAAYQKQIDDFKIYIDKKEADGKTSKFCANSAVVRADYLFLSNRLAAVERAISKLLGKNALKIIEKQYEAEMIKRILEEREHR